MRQSSCNLNFEKICTLPSAYTGTTFTNFTAERISATDYSPFGAPLAGRTWNGGEYRYGFNTQERDDEIAGVGNIMTAQFWEYDARLGRRWNLDPKVNPSIGSYVCFANNPLIYSDPYGDTLFSIGSSTQNLKDLRGMVNPNLRSRITISQIASRNDGMGDYVSINSAGYVAGTDAGMDLLISLSGNSINSAYSTADLPIGERAGPNREASSTSVPILVPYDESGVTVFTLTPKESLLGNTSKFRNGNFPPSKNVTGPGAMPGQIVVVPITLDFLVAINPNISRFKGTNGRKEIPRSMVAFQQLQTALLFTNNSRTNINSTFDQAYRATNFMLRSALLVGGNYNGERLVRYPLVPDVTKLRN